MFNIENSDKANICPLDFGRGYVMHIFHLHRSCPLCRFTGPATSPRALRSLLVLAAQYLTVPSLEPLFEALIHSKCHCLTWCDPHYARCDALVKSVHTFLFPHVTRDGTDPAPGCLPRCTRCLLQARLDGVNRSVAQRTHGAAHKSDEHRLPARKFATSMVCRLQILQPGFQASVGREVDGLIRTLA